MALAVASGFVMDAASNDCIATTGMVCQVDHVSPAGWFDCLDSSPTSNSVVRYRLSFSNAVWGLTANSLMVTASNLSPTARALPPVGLPGGSVYTVTVVNVLSPTTGVGLVWATQTGKVFNAAGMANATLITSPAYTIVSGNAVILHALTMLLGNGSAHGSTVPALNTITTTNEGSIITVRAIPDLYYQLDYWTNSAGASSSSTNWSIPMDGDRTVTVYFAASVTTSNVPTWWLAQYGWTSNFTAAATNDLDGDGVPTYQEYGAGTDPTNKNSVFAVLRIDRTAGLNTVVWYGTTNSGVSTPFEMYRTTDLMGGFTRVTNGIQRSVNGTNQWVDSNPPVGGAVFYLPKINW
jgi:Divergent InlB B-repeat domain